MRLVSCAKSYVEAGSYSPVEIMKHVMRSEKCSLGEAKEAFTLAANNETLGKYQERVILPLIEEMENYDTKTFGKDSGE